MIVGFFYNFKKIKNVLIDENDGWEFLVSFHGIMLYLRLSQGRS